MLKNYPIQKKYDKQYLSVVIKKKASFSLQIFAAPPRKQTHHTSRQ